MAGCMGLMQAPIFLCFVSIPSAISLRQKDFFGQIYLLLTLFMSYHFMFQHVESYCVSNSGLNIFFYMKMTTGDQQMAGPTQEGMPMQQNDENNDLCFINDVVFFNSYASD
jgi:YidC/Oxa1 family membrane protein insertase